MNNFLLFTLADTHLNVSYHLILQRLLKQNGASDGAQFGSVLEILLSELLVGSVAPKGKARPRTSVSITHIGDKLGFSKRADKQRVSACCSRRIALFCLQLANVLYKA
jgi:hypothetical protein